MSGCKAVLNIKGEHFGCQGNAPHPFLAHASRAAEAIWVSDVEHAEIDRMQAQMALTAGANKPAELLTDARLDAQIRGEQA